MTKISTFFKLLISTTLLVSLFQNTTNTAHAQVTNWAEQTGITAGNLGGQFGNFSSVSNTVTSAVNLILFGAALIAFIFILWGAFNYVMAGDSSEKTEKARKTITNAVVGLILVSLSFVIWQIVLSITGLNVGLSGGGTYNTTDGRPPAADCSNVRPGTPC